MIYPKLSLLLIPAVAVSAAPAGVGDVFPVHPTIANASVGELEVVGNGLNGDVAIVVELLGVDAENTPFSNAIALQFYDVKGEMRGAPRSISASDISDARGNNDGDIDNNDILTIDVTTALQDAPAAAYAFDVIFYDQGGTIDSMYIDDDGFPFSEDNSDDTDQLYRVVYDSPRIAFLSRSDSDKNGVDDTITVHVDFPALGFGVNSDVRGSFQYPDSFGVRNPNSISVINTVDWEKDTGSGFEQFEASDIESVRFIQPGDTTITFSFDEKESDLRAPGGMDRIRTDAASSDLRDGTGNRLMGEGFLIGITCLDGAQGLADCNENGLCDRDEIANGMVNDCNENGVPDICEILAGAEDYNQNGILDECESDPLADLDGDGVVGTRDLAIILAAWGPVLP